MSAKRYTVRMASGDTWTMVADMTEASAPIQYEADGTVCDSSFQTADARHDAYRAAKLCVALWARQSGNADSVESVEVES